MSIGERPFTVCRTCDPPHIDNCETCFGFGVYPRLLAGEPVPIGAARAKDDPPPDAIPCPTCGSTVKGVPA